MSQSSKKYSAEVSYFPYEIISSMYKGTGGLAGASGRHRSTLGEAVDEDLGSYEIPGKAPGLDRQYGNVGVDETMVTDTAPTNGYPRKGKPYATR